MPQFDLQSYIAKRQALAGSDKATDLVEAKQRKLQELSTATSLTPTENTSWAGQLGLDGEALDGGAVNMAASLVSGASRLAGNIASLPLNGVAAMIEADLSEDVIAARNRAAQGKATAADQALLQTKRSVTGQPGGAGNITNETAIARADTARRWASNVAKTFDLGDIVDQTNRDALSADLGNEFQGNWDQLKGGFTAAKEGKVLGGSGDMVSGLAGLLMNAGDAVGTNPQAVSEYVVENAPQLLVGALGAAGKAGMATSNVGYAADNYRQGIENYQAKNGGALPPPEQRQEMALYAASLALAEQVGDVAVLGLGKAKKALGTAVEGAEETVKTGGKQALLNSLKATLGGGAAEAATEGYQTFAEGEVTGKSASAKDIYTGTVIGGVSGAALSGGMRTLAEAAKATPEHQAEREQEAGKAAKFAEAVEKGDHTPFLDEKSKAYDPIAAVRVLYATSQKPDATPETKQKNLEAATEVVTNLEQKREELQSKYDSVSESGKKKLEAIVSQHEAALKATDPADTAAVARLTDAIAMNKEEIASYDSIIPANKKTAAKLETELSKLDRHLNDSRNVRDEMMAVESAKVKDVDVQADVKLADSGDTVAASRIISLSMSSPAKLTPEAALSLAKNSANGLKPEQREYLRAFSEARQTENKLRNMKRVSQEILTGENKAGGNIGIAQYRTRVAAALAANNKTGAEYHLGLLDSFRQDHAQKAAVAKQAYDLTLQDSKLRQVLRTPDNAGWMMTTDLVSEKARVANGGLEIHPVKSKNLVPSMQIEAQALTNAHAELSAAAGLRFGPGAVQSNASPTVPSQAPTATPASSSATQQKDAPGKNNLPPENVEKESRPSQSSGEPVASQQQKEAKDVHGGKTFTQIGDAYNYIRDNKLKASHKVDQTGRSEYTIKPIKASASTWQEKAAAKAAAEAKIAETAKAMAAKKESTAAASPSSAPSAPSLADARSGTAPSSAPAAEEGVDVQGLNTTPVDVQKTEDVAHKPDAAASQAAEQANGASAASAEPAVQAAPAGLRVFSLKKKIEGALNDAWAGINPIAQFLKQELTSERFKTARPLVHLTGFMSAWQADPMLPLQYLEEGDALLEKTDASNRMRRALNDLEQTLQAWMPLIDGQLLEHGGSKKFLTEDLMQFLVDRSDDGALSLDENIKTAMAYSAYSWALGQANAPAWKTDSEIAKMHGRGKEAQVTEAGRKDLRQMAGFEDRVIHELGDLAVQALGIVNDANAPGDILPRLKIAMGTHVLMLLTHPKVGMAKRAAVKNSTVQSYFIAEGDADADNDTETGEDPMLANLYEGFNTYVRFVREADTRTLTGAAQRIRDANKESRGVVDRLFGADKAPRVAGTTPVEFRQKFAKNTQQEVTPAQAETIQESMDDPFRPIPEMMDVTLGLGRAGILAIAGHEDVESGFLHDRNKEAAEAQNMNLENQFDSGMEMLELDPLDLASRFTDAVLTTPRYVEQSIWKNFRAGFMNQSLNPQTSKIHRVLFARAGWTATIDMADTGMKNELKIAIAMGLGVKTDEQRNAGTLAKFDAELQDSPEILEAVDVLRRAVVLKDTSAWTDDTRALVVRVAKEREGMQSLQAMVAYAKLLEAEKSGATEVDITLLVGVDGKTNGPMLSHLALGAADDIDGFYTLLNRGGFYSTDAGQADHYGQWYEGEDSQDLYENLGSRIVERVAEKVKPAAEMKALMEQAKATNDSRARGKLWAEYFRSFTLDDLRAIELVTKELVDKTTHKATKAMRKLTKVPLTSFAFGSSLRKSIENMQANFIDSYYSNLEDMARAGASQADVAAYLRSMNSLVRMGNSKDNKADPISVRPIGDMLKLKLTAAQEKSLRAAFKRVIGNSVEEEMKEYFATFIERRKQLNNTIQSAYQAYEAAYTEAKMAEMERLMEAGEVAYRISKKADGTEVRVPWHDLSPKQDKALRDSIASLLPVMHSHYSIKDNNLKAGLYMAKTKVNVSSSPLYTSKVYVNRNINRMVKNQKTGEYEAKSYQHMVTQAQTRVEQSPGVAGAAYSIHSSDSSIMHQMLAKVKGSLNVHDEGGNGVHKVRDVARELNAATAETFLEYSPAREAAFMLERAITNMAKQIREGKMTPAAAVRMVRDWEANYNTFLPPEFQITAEEAAEATLKDALENAYRADYMRLSALAKLKSVDQYVWEGGQFVADDKFRARAQKKLDDLQLAPSPATKADLAYLIEQFKANRNDELKAAAWVDIKREERADKETSVAKPNPISDLGKPATRPDPALVEAFNKTPVMSLKQALTLLRGHLKDDFSQKLLSQLARTVPDGLELRYITAATQPAELMAIAPRGSAGWYATSLVTGERAIYVLSPEFKSAMLTPELMLHELTHAALYGAVQYELDERASGAPMTDAGKLVQELEQLQSLLKSKLSESDATMFAPALTNVHEFIAYGMTNPLFQATLMSVTMESQTQSNRLVTAMQKFIEAVTGLVFGRKNATMANGMQLLVQNVAGLMESARETNRDLGQTAVLPAQNLAAPMTAEAIFDALNDPASTVSPGFQLHLRSLLGGIVEKLHGPFGVFKDLIATTQATDPTDIWLEAKQTGVAPFASRALALPIPFSEQEAFVLEQVEVTVRTAIAGNEGMTTAAYRELSKLYDEVAKTLTKQDFITAGLDPALHDFVFDITTGADRRSDYLSRFAALGLANQQFAGMLGFATASAPTVRAGMTLVERLHLVFDQILGFFSGKLTQTFAGQDADEKLESLINALVKIEVKKRHKLAQRQSLVMEHVEDVFRKGSNLARGKIVKFGRSRLFQNSRSNVVQATGTVISVVAGDRVEQLLEAMNTLRDQHFHKRHGVTAGIINEVRGANDTNLESHSLIREAKNNERHRKEDDDHTARFVLESFDQGGAYLSKEQKEAVSHLLRVDTQSLLGGHSQYDLNDILRMITVPAALDREIAALEKQLASSRFANFYMNAADGLGYALTGGPVKTKRLLLNAGNIARGFTTTFRSRITEAQAQQFEPIIDELASLYALRHTDGDVLAQAATVLKTELARTDKGNGIEMVLKLHRDLLKQSKDRLFRDSEALMMKGYTPEIYDPYMDVRVATEQEGQALLDQGYAPGLEVAIDPNDPDQEKKFIYSLRDGGLERYLTGIVSYDGMRARGSRKHDGNTSLVSAHGMQNASTMAQINAAKQNDERDMLRSRIDMRTAKNNPETYLAPVVNPQGDAVNWRYMMNGATKDHLLKRDNRFEQVLGRMAGSIVSKESTGTHNRKTVEALKAQYDAEYATKASSYIKISPVSNDPEMRQIWNMLPESTKQAVRDVWGREEMQVRIDLLDITFGYRKLTLSRAFEKEVGERTMFETWFVEFWEHFLGAKAALRVRQGEDIWETIVREAKDIIVVKSGITLLGNQLSNMSLLLAYGVGPRAMLHHHRIAMKGAMDHRRDSAELFRLQRALEIGHTAGGDVAAMRKRVGQLQDALARNPVRQLIEAGLMPTIVEDIAGDDDLYSYKSQLTKQIEERLAKFNPTVLKAAKLVYMTHDTKMYRALSYGTQLSDFVARYTLYQHLTTKKDPMDPKKAIQSASDAFINYDVPSHRVLQKLNDAGLVWFTKYYLRVQKVIMHLYRENPGRALMLLAFNNYFDWVPTVLDSAVMNRIGNPFGLGALTYPSVLDDLATMKAAALPFK